VAVFTEQGVTFSAGVDRLRYLAMWRPSHIHRARISTGREPYDGPGPMRSWWPYVRVRRPSPPRRIVTREPAPPTAERAHLVVAGA